MTIDQLNLEPFYYVEPMRIIDNDPDAAFEFINKYDEEKEELKKFLKESSSSDFLKLIINIFKNEYADGALLGSFVSETILKEKTDNGTIYVDEFYHRKEFNHPKYKFDNEDRFEHLEFKMINPLSNINDIVQSALEEKEYIQEGNIYNLSSDSGIEYIEASESIFKLKANMSSAKRFH